MYGCLIYCNIGYYFWIKGKFLKDFMVELSYGVGFLELYVEEVKCVYGDIIFINVKSWCLFVLK